MPSLLTALRSRWNRLMGPTPRLLHGWPVQVEHDGDVESTAALHARLERVLRMIETALPGHLAALREHVAVIRVTRFPCRGAFVPATRELIVERTFLADPARHDAEIGATLVHEGEHARLRGSGLADQMSAAEEERACREVEIALGERVPGGERVLARARAALQLADHDVAPAVDWDAAWRNVDAR